MRGFLLCAVLHGSATDEAVVSAAGGAVVSIAVEVVLAGVVVGLSGFVVDPVAFARICWFCCVRFFNG